MPKTLLSLMCAWYCCVRKYLSRAGWRKQGLLRKELAVNIGVDGVEREHMGLKQWVCSSSRIVSSGLPGEGEHVGEALQGAVHVAAVAQVVQPDPSSTTHRHHLPMIIFIFLTIIDKVKNDREDNDRVRA